MAVQIKISSFSPAIGGVLWPYPTGGDLEAIQAIMSSDKTPVISDPINALFRPIKVICDYHKVLLYLEGGITVFRTDPVTEGGVVIFPPSGTIEDVRITIGHGEYMSKIEFV
jgi:hypothetical protein